MNRTYLISNIQGGYDAMMECFEGADFDDENDELIVLGNAMGCLPDSRKVIRKLNQIKRLTYIFGEQDYWLREWLEKKRMGVLHYRNGGEEILKSYRGKTNALIRDLNDLYKRGCFYYVDTHRNLFVYSGINGDKYIGAVMSKYLVWNRKYIYDILSGKIVPTHAYPSVYIGSVPTTMVGKYVPFRKSKLIFANTGLTTGGQLSILEVNNDGIDYYQSSNSVFLYPKHVHEKFYIK